MTVEDRIDQFPVGMRVLAVDDDPTCLKLLESLLRRCQYHVTTTNQAITALKLLRENKSKFDLVISDVHMPDMDGFKLLELVGLEMDLPVIMLSANSDTRAVMKGISHGAVDYLLKPVRIEELRNIWQHVIRRKKFEKKEISDRENGDPRERVHRSSGSDCWQGPGSETSDSNGRLNRKRKDQIDEEDDSEDNGNENDDSSSQKKPRVVWSVDLHRKFVAAVNELGIDKAVPKRILELMNVERLTRENVASHLQKYRLYLKRIHAVTSQQSNGFSNLASKEAYLSMCSMDGIGSFNAGTSSRQLPMITPFQSTATPVNARLNSLSGIRLQGLSSSGVIQLDQGNSIQDLGIRHVSPLNRIPTATVTAGNQFLGGFGDSSTFLDGSHGGFLNDLRPRPPPPPPPPVNPFPTTATYSALPPNRNLTSTRNFNSETSCIASLTDIGLLDASSLCGVDRFAVNLAEPDGGNPLTFPYEVSGFGYAGGPRQKSLEAQGQGQREQLTGCSLVNHGGQSEFDFGMFDQQAFNLPLLSPCSNVEETTGQSVLKVKTDYQVGPSLLQLPAAVNPNAGSYEDPMNAMIKTESDDNILLDGDLGCDFYSLEACM